MSAIKDNRVFYLAGPFGDQALMVQRRAIMRLAGYDVRASWIDEPAAGDHAVSDFYLMSSGQTDLEEVRECDVLVVFPGIGAGHHTEFGIALEGGKGLVVVGKKNNIFHHLSNVRHFDTFDDFMSDLVAGSV